jgi:hypothetical protein
MYMNLARLWGNPEHHLKKKIIALAIGKQLLWLPTTRATIHATFKPKKILLSL